MRNFSFKIIIALLLITINKSYSLANTNAKDKFKSIEEFVAAKKLTIKLIGLGGHTGECVKLDMANITPDTLFIKLEAGRRFVSADTTEQDIFIVKELLFSLLPKEKKTMNAFGFCCEATMHSPKYDSKFSIGKMAPDDWVKLAQFLSINKFENAAMQNAVWVMSNDHQISTVVCKSQPETGKLRRKLAELKHIEVPWYTLQYEEVSNQVFSDKHKRIFGPVEFTLRESGIITIQVRDANGEVVAVPLNGSEYMNGENLFTIDLDVKDWPKGKYTIFVFKDGMMRINKKEFTL